MCAICSECSLNLVVGQVFIGACSIGIFSNLYYQDIYQLNCFVLVIIATPVCKLPCQSYAIHYMYAIVRLSIHAILLCKHIHRATYCWGWNNFKSFVGKCMWICKFFYPHFVTVLILFKVDLLHVLWIICFLKRGWYLPNYCGWSTSCLCCFAVHPSIPGIFLPYGQVGVGIPRGLEAAIHATHHCITQNACIKNAFNWCSCSALFAHIDDEFLEISACVKWCYSQPAELWFGLRHIHTSSWVQQGDPLGPLLFSLVLPSSLTLLGFIT